MKGFQNEANYSTYKLTFCSLPGLRLYPNRNSHARRNRAGAFTNFG